MEGFSLKLALWNEFAIRIPQGGVLLKLTPWNEYAFGIPRGAAVLQHPTAKRYVTRLSFLATIYLSLVTRHYSLHPF